MVQEQGQLSAKQAWRTGFLWLAIIALSRGVLIAVLYKLTGGKQFTDDMFHYAFLGDPWGIFTGQGDMPQSFPPLVPVVIYLIGKPLSLFLGEFAVLRVTYTIFELLAWVVMIDVLRKLHWNKRLLHFAGLIWMIAPILWLSDAVKMQEESISLLFMTLILWAVVQSKLRTAIVFASLGVVAAKIFFLIPLLALVVYPPVLSFRQYVIRGGVAAIPLVIVYGAVQIMTSAGSSVDSLSEFVPPIQQVTTFWALLAKLGLLGETLPESAAIAKRYSAILALIAGLVPFAWMYLRRCRFDNWYVLAALMGSMIMAVYSVFYHINPPYFVIIVPILLVVFRPIVSTLWIVVGLSFVWAINVTRGVALARATGDSQGKDAIVKLYDSIAPFDADVAHTICLVTFIILSFALAIQLLIRADRQVRSLAVST